MPIIDEKDLDPIGQTGGQGQFGGQIITPDQLDPVGPSQSYWPTIKNVGSALYEGSPIPGIVEGAKTAILPFKPSTYAGLGETLERPFFSQEGFGGQLARGALKTLPAAGGLVGGAIGVGAGGGVASPVLGAAGMGLGYSMGDRAQKLLESYLGLYQPKSAPEEWKETAYAVGTGAKAFMQGESGTKMLAGIGGPFSGRFAKPGPEGETARLGQQMVEEKMPLSPDVYVPTRTNKFLQWTSDNLIPGGNIFANKRRQEIVNTISQMRDDFVENAGLPNPNIPMAKAQALQKEAYKVFVQEGAGVQVPFSKTYDYIQSVIDSPEAKTSQFWKSKVTDFRNKIEAQTGGVPAGMATVDDANDILANVWPTKGKSTWEKMDKTQKGLRSGLVEAINSDLAENDLAKGTKVLETLDAARQTVKNKAELARGKYLERMLGSSTDFNPKTQQFEFQPGKFYADVMKKRELLENKFPNEIDNIMRFAEKAKLASADVARMSSRSPLEQAYRIGAQGAIGTGAAAAIFANPILAVPLAFPTIASYSLMNPSGKVRKFLTSGIKPPTLTKEAIEIGVMNQED